VLAARSATGVPQQLVEIATKWFFETVTRLYGKGDDRTQINHESIGNDPVAAMTERALETRNANELIELLSDSFKEELRDRFEKALSWQGYDESNVKEGRQFVQAMLGFVLYAHHLCQFLKSGDKNEESNMNNNLNMVADTKRRSEIIGKAKMFGHNHHKAIV